MTRRIPLSPGMPFETKVSPEDYDYLTQWLWQYKRSSRKYAYAIYARRSSWKDGRKITILMHRVILERMGLKRPTKKHTGDHKNNNTLDNRRENLRWATKRQQSRNQRRYK